MSEHTHTVFRCDYCGTRQLDVCPPNWLVSVSRSGTPFHACTKPGCVKFLNAYCAENGYPIPRTVRPV